MLKYLFLITFSFQVFGQRDFSKYLINDWKKSEIKSKDGSRIFDPTINTATFDIKIYSKDSLRLFTSGRAANYYYTLKDSTLSFNKMVFKIKKLSETELQIEQADYVDEMQALSINFIPKKLFDLTYSPSSYVSKMGELVYQKVDGKLEPYFIDKNMSVMDFIFEKFEFPEYRKGGFVVRFVVTATGEIKGAKVIATSNERYNDKLVAAVYKTKGKWQPASYMGQKVNVEVEYDFNLGYEERQITSTVDSTEYSKMYFSYGNEFFERGSYKQAEAYYKKSINYNPLNIMAYYQHAATSILLRRKDEACEDYKQLVFLDQKKAKTLSDKYCN